MPIFPIEAFFVLHLNKMPLKIGKRHAFSKLNLIRQYQTMRDRYIQLLEGYSLYRHTEQNAEVSTMNIQEKRIKYLSNAQ